MPKPAITYKKEIYQLTGRGQNFERNQPDIIHAEQSAVVAADG